MAKLRKTPLRDAHARLGASFAPVDGWELPVEYSSQAEEHLAVRTGAGVFDVSHLGQLAIGWSWSHDYLQARLTNDLDRIGPGQTQYTLLTDETGGLVDDLVAFRMPTGYLLTVGAANVAADLELLAEMDDVSDDWAMLAVQGPRSLELLGVEVERRTFRRETVLGVDCLLSGTGYTGELGCELLCNAGDVGELFDRVLAAGITPCGSAARDSLRIEMGYVRHGSDVTRERNPYEADLGNVVRLGKSFVGLGELRRVKRRPPTERLVGFLMDDERVPAPGAAIEGGGTVTSSAYSPVLERGIALGYVWRGIGNPGKELTIEVDGAPVLASIVHRPRETPPRDPA